jgi:hypothetical protein
MQRAAPKMKVHIVEGQGHAPLLLDEPTIARIASFILQEI